MSDNVITLPIPPIVKIATVCCEPAKAFLVFTVDIGHWYPLAMASLNHAVDCRLEPHVGGRLYEIGVDGQETAWGHVLEWNPPHSLALSWKVHCSDEEAQRIDISFRAVPEGTEVKLVHSGWEKLKVNASGMREQYNQGWAEIFERRFRTFADQVA